MEVLSPRSESARGHWAAAKDLAIAAFLAVLPILFFWRFLSTDPASAISFPIGDFTNLHFPYRLFETRELLQGHLPLWNPYVYGGVSTLGDIQYGIFYPINILTSLLLGRNGYTPMDLTWQIVAHFSLAGVFTYMFARRLLDNRPAALVSAVVFTFSGYLTSFPVQQIIILETSAMLPLILFFLDKGIVERSRPCFAAAGVVAAMAIFVGHPQTFVYDFFGIATYTAFRIWTARRDSTEPGQIAPRQAQDQALKPFRWHIILTGLALFLAMTFGLAAIQLVPSYELLSLTARTSVSYAFVERGFSLRELIGLLFPTMAGGRFLYVGVATLLLAMVALLSPADRRQKAFWLALGCFTLVLSFGSQTFLQPLAYVMVPGFKAFRDHERTVFLFALASAMLAGYGMRALITEIDLPRVGAELRQRFANQANWLRWLAFLIAAFALSSFMLHVGATGDAQNSLGELADRGFFTLIIFTITWAALHLITRSRPGTANRQLLAALLVGIVLLDLFSSNWRNNVDIPKTPPPPPPQKTIDYLTSDKTGPFRIASEGLLPGFGNAGALYQLEDIVGDSPLVTQAYTEFEDKVDEMRRWQLLNVKYVLTTRKLNDGRLIPIVQEGAINTYELAPSLRLPRAFIVYKATIAATSDRELQLTKSIDPHTEVVLDKAVPITLPSQPPDKSSASIIARQDDRIELQTSSPANGLLVLSEMYYPGWKAFVDDRPVEILRADYLLRAIPIEQGSHHVELIYDPPSLHLGEIISLLSVALLMGVVVAWMVSRARLHGQGG